MMTVINRKVGKREGYLRENRQRVLKDRWGDRYVQNIYVRTDIEIYRQKYIGLFEV